MKLSSLSQVRHRIAVLSLIYSSPDPTDGYFTDGVTEELILTLSKIARLRVIAPTSIMKYRKEPKTSGKFARETITTAQGCMRPKRDTSKGGLDDTLFGGSPA